MFRLRYAMPVTVDPEELVEAALLWKAMRGVHGADIHPLKADQMPFPGDVIFGLPHARQREAAGTLLDEKYWAMPAFTSRLSRSFKVCNFEQAGDEVDRLSREGKGAFIKSMKAKEFVGSGEPGSSILSIMGDMVYSYMDIDRPTLMVQERVEMTHEYRCIVLDGNVVTASPVLWCATPDQASSEDLEGHHPIDLLYKHPGMQMSEFCPMSDVTCRMRQLAGEIARDAGLISGTVDLCLINGDPQRIEPIEINVGWPGAYGLYFSDPVRIAQASPAVLKDVTYRPDPRKATMASIMAAGHPVFGEEFLETDDRLSEGEALDETGDIAWMDEM